MSKARLTIILLIGIGGLVLASCTYDHSVSAAKEWAGRVYLAEYYEIQRNSTERIPGSAKIYVPFPVTILGPKADVPQMEYLCASLQRRFPLTYCALRPESHEAALKNASIRGDNFLLNAEVVHWSDKQKPNQAEEDARINDTVFYNNAGIDRLEIQMNIYYVRSDSIFDAISLKARSPVLAGFFDQPVELLRYAYADLVEAVSSEKNL